MNTKDFYNPLPDFSKELTAALKAVNSQMMDCFANSIKMKELFSASAVVFNSNLSSIKQTIRVFTDSYAQMFRQYDLGHSMSDALRITFAELQVSTMLQLSQSVQTSMIRDLSTCFANAQYERLAGVLNRTMSQSFIEAPDVAFIKTSKLVHTLRDELIYPKGFYSSLRVLNTSAAEGIAESEEIEYDTKKNRFITQSGETNSKGLNIISSGKEILTVTSGERFSEAELINFLTFLSETPTLALSAETGKKIFDFLRELFFSGEKTIGFDQKTYYHCRSHKYDETPFTYAEMLKAPYGLPWAGRFNHVGQSNYYFADSQTGSEAEIKKHQTDNEVLQTVILHPKKEIKLLDLSGTLARGATFLRYLRFGLSDISNRMPREYLIPCFVSDCCKKIGFEGIKYYGSKEYNNYVTWNDGYFTFGGMCQ